MYNAAKMNPQLFRLSALMVACVYAYFGFVAALHHRDGFLPTGKTLTLHALECGHPHPEISSDSGAPECGVCEFLANLQYPAAAVAEHSIVAPELPSLIQCAESLNALRIDSTHSPRGPPQA